MAARRKENLEENASRMKDALAIPVDISDERQAEEIFTTSPVCGLASTSSPSSTCRYSSAPKTVRNSSEWRYAPCGPTPNTRQWMRSVDA